MCSECSLPLDSGSRGALCSVCWQIYVFSLFKSMEEVRQVCASLTTREGKSFWLLPTEIPPARKEATQLSLFEGEG